MDPEKVRALMGMGTPLDEATWVRCLRECPEIGDAPPAEVYANLRALSQQLALGGESLRALVSKAPGLMLVDANHVQEEVRCWLRAPAAGGALHCANAGIAPVHALGPP